MNIEQLLMPLSEASPCGEDLSFSHEFDAIAELRREDDPTLDQGEWVTALKTADWPAVLERCTSLLSSRSKDLRLAMWWAEAAALTDGYAGLQHGLVLCNRLCENHWDGLYPDADGGDMEQRAGNVGWFIGRMVSLSAAVPVAKGRSGAYSLQQMYGARSLQTAIERSPEKAAQVAPDTLTWDKFNRALRETPKDEIRRALASLQACQEALTAWQSTIDARLGNEGPSFAPARDALESARHELQRLARDVGAVTGTTADGSAGSAALSSDGAAAVPGETGRAEGSLRTREQALAQLRQVAAFFRSTEPHSPVAYLADKAVRWGDMPLHLWLRSVVKDSAALSHLEELLGLDVPRDDAATG